MTCFHLDTFTGGEKQGCRHGKQPAEGQRRPNASLCGLTALQHYRGHAAGDIRAFWKGKLKAS